MVTNSSNSKNTVYNLCDEPQPFVIKNILVACKHHDIKQALTQLKDLFDKGYSSSDISISILNILKSIHIDEIDEYGIPAVVACAAPSA